MGRWSCRRRVRVGGAAKTNEMGCRGVEEAEGGGAGVGATPSRRRRRRERPVAAVFKGAGDRRQERRKGGAHEQEGVEWVLTAWSVEAGEHPSGPATGARGGAGRLTVAAM